jgi:hypothetical protein
MHVNERLKLLVSTFGRDLELARQLESPNSEDDLTVRAAIVGFSYNAPTTDWDISHHDFLRKHLDGHFSLVELQEWTAEPIKLQWFAAIGLGFLLGLYQSDAIDAEKFEACERQIAGLIALHVGELVLVELRE